MILWQNFVTHVLFQSPFVDNFISLIIEMDSFFKYVDQSFDGYDPEAKFLYKFIVFMNE